MYTLTNPAKAKVPTASRQISLGTLFNWTVGEVIQIEGNLYVYQGYEVPYKLISHITLRIASFVEDPDFLDPTGKGGILVYRFSE